MVDIPDHVHGGSLFGGSSEKLWLVGTSDMSCDGTCLSKLQISIDEVRQVGEVKTQVELDG